MGDQDAMPVSLLTRFQIKGQLGRGGMGRVIEAMDAKLGRRVAIKLFDAPALDDV